MIASPHALTRNRAAGLWAWLIAAMVLAQSLGFMHGIVHAVPAQVERQVCPLQAEVHGRAITGWVADLFAVHDDESDCRLYDQFSHGDCAPAMPVLCIPSLAVADFSRIFEAPSPVTPAALVQARGPPPFR